MDGKVDDFVSMFKPVVGQVAGKVTGIQQEVKQSVDEVKQAAVAYGGLTLFFQAVAAASAAFLAYTAWQQHKITRNRGRRRR